MKWFRPRWNKVFADLWSNKIRSLLVVASITIGIYAAGIIISIYGILVSDMRASYEEIQPANIIINAPDFDQAFSKTVKHMPEVADAQAVRTFALRMHVPAQTPGGEDAWININIKAVPDFYKMTTNHVSLLEGSWPPRDKEIVFDQHKFIDAKIRVGDIVEIKLPDGKTLRQVPLVGLVKDQSIGATGGGGYFTADLTGYVNFNTLEWLQQPEMANMLQVRVKDNSDDRANLFAVAGKISKKFDENNIPLDNFFVRATSDHPNAIYVDAISGILFILGFLVVFLSGFLITNTLSALLNQQIEQIGILKTLGGRTRQIMGIYMVLILVYSLIALGIAVPLAGRTAYWMLNFVANEVNFIPQGYHEVPLSIMVQVIIALIVPQVAGFLPILRGSMISVQEAVNGPSLTKTKNSKTWVNRLSENIRGLSRPLLISLRNTFRRKTRLLLTLVTLTLGGAIFIATFNVQSSMNAFITSLGNYFAADVTLDFSQPYHTQKIESMLEQQPNVGDAEGWAAARGELLLAGDKPAESVNILAPPVNSKLIQPIMLEGRWLVAGDENAITINDNFKSRFPDLKVGDTLRMNIYGKKVDWVVVGFFQFAGKSSGLIAYANYDYLSKITHTSLKASSYQIISTQPDLTLDQQEAQGRALEVIFNNLGYHINDVSAGQSMLKSATSGLNVLIIFLLFMAVLAAVVGSIGLTGTLSMNVLDRTREFAVMRAIGASDHAVMRLVVVEGLMIGLMSWILGSLLAFPISEMMWTVISKSLFDVTSAFTFNYVGFVLWMVVVLALSVIASVIPARSAARLTIREALAYE